MIEDMKLGTLKENKNKEVTKEINNNSGVYFSDYFGVSHELINTYGALDISIKLDSPAFVDPFLIFFREDKKYKELHKFITKYLVYLRKVVDDGNYNIEKRNFLFKEVKQVWLGYSSKGNAGTGLGPKFAESLRINLRNIASASNDISKGQHMEKLCILGDRIGVDKISDFTLNLIKYFLVDYTEKFAMKNIESALLDDFKVERVIFDFDKGEWLDKNAKLPFIINNKGKKEYVLLIPKDILVKSEGWISKNHFLDEDYTIITKIENIELRNKVNKYFLTHIPEIYNKKTKSLEPHLTKKNVGKALHMTAKSYPQLLDYYIKKREDNGDIAIEENEKDMEELGESLHTGVKEISNGLEKLGFGKKVGTSLEESIEKVQIFKDYIEKRGGDKVFWTKARLANADEKIIQFMLDLVFHSSTNDFSIDKEVNNGRGPADFKVSKGPESTIIEVKLAKNTQMKKNLSNQLNIYMDANQTDKGIYVIIFFTKEEEKKLYKDIEEVGMLSYIDKKIFIIDGTKKISASKVG